MKKIYIHHYSNGKVSYSSSVSITIGGPSQATFSIDVPDEDADAFFDNPNNFIVDEGRGVLIRKT